MRTFAGELRAASTIHSTSLHRQALLSLLKRPPQPAPPPCPDRSPPAGLQVVGPALCRAASESTITMTGDTLNDLQLILLAHAAKSGTGHVFPLPAAAADRNRASKELKALPRRGLVAETETANPAQSWREDGDLHFGLVITPQGNAAIGLGEGEAGAPDSPTEDMPLAEPARAPREVRRGSKIANVVGLLQRSEGATLAELVEATGWLPHTTRAALTGLKKKGHVIARGKRDDATCYTIAGEP